MILTKTPFRISFFGGGTDYPAWYQKHGGSVLATSIDKYCYLSCRYLPPFFDHKYRIAYAKVEYTNTIEEIEHPAVKGILNYLQCDRGLEIHYNGDLPARSGLGSSSSFSVGLLHVINALKGRYISRLDLAKQAIHVEQNVIGENVGSQDQISAALGGFNRIEFLKSGDFIAEPVLIPAKRKQQLSDNLMLFFTGIQRDAPSIAKDKINNLLSREKQLTQMKAMVNDALTLLGSEQSDIRGFGELLDYSWMLKQQLSDKINLPSVAKIYESAKQAGAIGGKLLGAGGGGFLLLFVPPENQPHVRKALHDLIHVPFKFEEGGSQVALYQPTVMA